jgi:3-oxoacyl-[acyl-carrier protein] reductase
VDLPTEGSPDLTEELWDAAIDGTLRSVIRLVRHAEPHLAKSDRAAIGVVLSSSAKVPIDGLVTSNVLRPGLAALVKSLAFEFGPQIRVIGFAPGRITTDRVELLDRARAERSGVTPNAVRARNAEEIPLGRYGAPAEFGRVATFLLSPAASYVSGTVVFIDGGATRAL